MCARAGERSEEYPAHAPGTAVYRRECIRLGLLLHDGSVALAVGFGASQQLSHEGALFVRVHARLAEAA